MIGIGFYVVRNFNKDVSVNKGTKYSLLALCIFGIIGTCGSLALQILILASGSALSVNMNSQEYLLSNVVFMYMSTGLMPAVIAILAYMQFKKQ